MKNVYLCYFKRIIFLYERGITVICNKGCSVAETFYLSDLLNLFLVTSYTESN